MKFRRAQEIQDGGPWLPQAMGFLGALEVLKLLLSLTRKPMV
jgi:hypothetical protein